MSNRPKVVDTPRTLEIPTHVLRYEDRINLRSVLRTMLDYLLMQYAPSLRQRVLSEFMAVGQCMLLDYAEDKIEEDIAEEE